MIYSPFGYARILTKRERKRATAAAQVRAQEIRAEHDARDRRAAEKKRASWERMKADIAAKYARG